MTSRAVVRLRDSEIGDGDQVRRLQEYMKQTLQPHKNSRIVEFVTEIPTTGTGKVDRQALLQAPVREGNEP